MDNSSDRNFHHAPESTIAPRRCVVCGSPSCASVNDHGIFKAQLAQTVSEITIATEPVIVRGRQVGHLMTAQWDENGALQISAQFILDISE